MTMSQALLPEFDQEMRVTRTVLERVDDEKFDWKPHEKSTPMGKLATHIAGLPALAVRIIHMEGLDRDKQPATTPAANRAAILALFDKNVAEAREAIKGATDDRLRQPWFIILKGKKVFEGPRVGMLRTLVMSHLIHHRGQLSVYLRLNDIPVPSIYGPSADEGR
jgi:uncharacterized damage-inducible protein DinB